MPIMNTKIVSLQQELDYATNLADENQYSRLHRIVSHSKKLQHCDSSYLEFLLLKSPIL